MAGESYILKCISCSKELIHISVIEDDVIYTDNNDVSYNETKYAAICGFCGGNSFTRKLTRKRVTLAPVAKVGIEDILEEKGVITIKCTKRH